MRRVIGSFCPPGSVKLHMQEKNSALYNSLTSSHLSLVVSAVRKATDAGIHQVRRTYHLCRRDGGAKMASKRD